ncbi:Phosphotransferase enzyme [Coniothyrium glycines]
MTVHQGLLASIAKRQHIRLRHVQAKSRWLSSSVRVEKDSLFQYTSGRWLWNEREHLEARQRWFSVPNLQQVACRATGAETCILVEKIGEGNYNKAYRLEMDNGQKIIAKVPHPNAGPPVLTTSSEVATMEFVRSVLNIPVPRVLAWSATDKNPVQAEYIIMEEARGSQLHKVWQDLPLRTKADVVSEFVEIEKRLLSVSFDRLGSLYFKDSGIAGCEPAVVREGVSDCVDHIEATYCIGPITRREFWEKERKEMHHHGPWTSCVDYLDSIAQREIDWINRYAKPHEQDNMTWQYVHPEQNSSKAHTHLLQKFRSAVPYIVPRDPQLVSPRLWHPDFHAGAWTAPAIIGANPPLVLDYGVDMLMKLPENFKSLDDATKDELRYQVSQSILIHKYEATTAEKNPLMHKVIRHPHGQTLKQLEAFAGSTWDNCLYPFQDCLINVEREWDHFGNDEPCPYQFSREELRRHDDEADVFNKSQEFWQGLRGVLTDEGYTSKEMYGQAVETVKHLRDAGLSAMEGEDRRVFEEETLWVESLEKI